jgi:PhnB protein
MIVQPYLYFGGRCEEALEFYRRAIGAEVGFLMRFDESPEPCGEGMIPANWGHKVMHCEFKVGDSVLMASDGMGEGAAKFDGISLSISTATDADCERVFAALGDGGKVQMPLTKTFFASKFGMVADKFGVSWMVITMKQN